MLAQIQGAIKQAFKATEALQTPVVLTHTALGALDSYTGTRATTTTTQTLNALVGQVEKTEETGREITRTSLYFDEGVLAIDIAPQDTARFGGETWIVEGPIEEGVPAFVRGLRVRRP